MWAARPGAGGMWRQERSRQLCLARYQREMLTDASVQRAVDCSRIRMSPQQQAVFEGGVPSAAAGSPLLPPALQCCLLQQLLRHAPRLQLWQLLLVPS